MRESGLRCVPRFAHELAADKADGVLLDSYEKFTETPRDGSAISQIKP
jgi:hypothetical protein